MSEPWQSVRTMIERTATAKGRASSGYFSIEGTRLHERAIRASAWPTAVLIADSMWQKPGERETAVLHQLAQQNIPIHPIPNAEMERLTQGRRLGGLLGLLPLPKPLNLANWLAAHSAPTLLVAVGVVDPGNVGGLIRTAHALGADLFVAAGGSDPYHPRAVRTSMGSIFKLPLVTTTLPELFATLRTTSIQTIGTVAEGGIALPNVAQGLRGTAVFMGSEYFGLPNELIDQLDILVTIPMSSGIDSFSVNAAAAIVLYELKRSSERKS
ncbi:TrmH family RNA methyltransferase [Candidatus Leptofilum sp.]|uniref:TrmH family RNA methyltransferase n=1 Tax=Candidatus Leptofilum sp. TaxID=3241576 RepID=UPI003B59DF0D